MLRNVTQAEPKCAEHAFATIQGRLARRLARRLRLAALGLLVMHVSCSLILSPSFARAYEGDSEAEQQIKAAGLSVPAFRALVQACAASKTDAIVLLRHGQVVVCRPSGQQMVRLPLRSVTKSIVSLAIGALIAEGKIRSLDTPVSFWFPEWATGRKAKVTLRHILEHTSGLEHEAGDGQMMSQTDVIAYVRRLPLVSEPGSQFSYNGEATMLLSGIIRSAAGESVSRYLDRRLFAPMGITDWHWDQDRASNDLTHTGLELKPIDLARIGQLMMDQGQWNGRQLIPAEWIQASTRPSLRRPDYGLLWWLLRRRDGTVIGFNGNGWLGQHLVVYPTAGVVAVRMRRGSATPTDQENQEFGLLRFPFLVRDLFKQNGPKPAK